MAENNSHSDVRERFDDNFSPPLHRQRILSADVPLSENHRVFRDIPRQARHGAAIRLVEHRQTAKIGLQAGNRRPARQRARMGKPAMEGTLQDPVDTENSLAAADDSAIERASREYVGRWNRLISSTNWEKGRIISQWREALIEAGAPAAACTDEA